MTDQTCQPAPPPPPARSRRRPHDRWVRRGFLIVAVGVAAILFFKNRSGDAPKNWRDDKDLSQALAIAKAENRPVLVLFVRDPMGQLEREVIKKVIEKPDNRKAVTNGNFVAVMVRNPSPGLRDQYKLTDFPTLMILDPQGKELRRRVGQDARPEVPFRSEFLKTPLTGPAAG